VIHAHNAFRLGDNLVQLNFLRRLCLQNPELEITHYYNPELCRFEEIDALRSDISRRLFLKTIDQAPKDSIDSWRGSDGYWYGHPDRLDFAKFHLCWFEELASRMAVKNPIRKTEDLLFDYWALESFIPMTEDFDVVVINSPGLSNQFTNFNKDDFTVLISKLVAKGHRVITTAPTEICPAFENKNVTWIGATAAKAKAIIGTSTGPSWPCLNVHNKDAFHLLCADTENVILTERGQMARSAFHAIHILEEVGLL
jgi:hypothetical protein